MHKHLLDLSYWVLNRLLFLIMFIVYLDFSVNEVKKLMKQSSVFSITQNKHISYCEFIVFNGLIRGYDTF